MIRNSKVEMFKNFMRLSVDKWGKISAFPDGVESTPPAPDSVNLLQNLSTVEYECVSAADAGDVYEAEDDAPLDTDVEFEAAPAVAPEVTV